MTTVDDSFWDDIFGDEEEIILPGIETIPVLDANYPLFSWDDWPESRAALVPGMPTKHFQRVTWNAIVDTVNSVLAKAGIEWFDPRFHDRWDEVPYTVEDSKILRPYGQIRADAFNTVCNNVDLGTPVRWSWHVDQGSRGYIGRPRFKGTTIIYDDEGAIENVLYGDHVYPEYILELVNRVNLMIELLRGSKPVTSSWVWTEPKSSVFALGTFSRLGARFERYYIASSVVQLPRLDSMDPVVLQPQHPSKTTTQSEMSMVPAAGIYRRVYSTTSPKVSGKVYFADYIKYLELQQLAKTSAVAELFAIVKHYFSAESQSWTSSTVLLDQTSPVSTSAQLLSSSKPEVSVDATRYHARDVSQLSMSNIQIDAHMKKKVLVDDMHVSKSSAFIHMYMAVITRICMHSNFTMLMQLSGHLARLLNILMHISYPMVALGQPKKDFPGVYYLGTRGSWLLLASPRTDSYSGLSLYLTDSTVFNSSSRVMIPESTYLHLLESVYYVSSADLAIARLTQMWLNQFDTCIVLVKLQLPEDTQQYVLGLWYYKCTGLLTSPQSVYQLIHSFWYFNASGTLEKPKKLQQFLHDLQMIMHAGVMRDRPRQIQAFQRLYDYLNCSSTPNDIEALLMYEYAGPICVGCFLTTSPRNIQGLVLFSTVVRGNASLNLITQQFLYMHDYAINTCQGVLQVPLECTLCISLQAPGGFIAGISWDTPRDIQMIYECLWQYECDAQLQDIAKVRMHSLVEEMQFAYASPHIPDTYFLWTKSIGLLNASTNLETPSQQQMCSELRFVSKVDEKLQGPQAYKMQGFVSFVSHIDEKIQKIPKYAVWITNDVIGYSAIYLQVPTATTYMQSEASEFLGLLNPFLKYPDSSALSTTLATASQGFAKLLEPTGVKADSNDMIQSIAHAFAKAALVTRTYTSGSVVIFYIAYTYPEIQPPSDTILWFTKSQGIGGSAYNVLAKAVNSAGIAYMLGVTGSAGHDLLSRVLGAGIGSLSDLYLLGAGDTARAIASAGRYVHIELISEFLCQYSLGREYHVRMHTNLGYFSSHLRVHNPKTLFGVGSVELPKIIGDAYGATQYPEKVVQHVTVEKLYTQASNVQSVEPCLIMCNADIGSTTSKAGATVRSGSWIYPVQTGSNLYIKQVYEATLVGTNLIIK